MHRARKNETVFKERRVLVDSDACPVKHEIAEITDSLGVQALFVASYLQYSERQEGSWVYVDPDREAADLYIANHVRSMDIVVTWDMGLAGLLTNRKVIVITPSGDLIKDEDIPRVLYTRHLARKERAAGNRTKGPRAYTTADRERFCRVLYNLLADKNGEGHRRESR